MLWRLILAPAVVLVIVYLLFTYPATVLYVASSGLAFSQDHPTASSAFILVCVGLFLTPYILPALLVGGVFRLAVAPPAGLRLPVTPQLPSFMVPAPVQKVCTISIENHTATVKLSKSFLLYFILGYFDLLNIFF